jgi:general L-amino acid transport system substrate-binding protein
LRRIAALDGIVMVIDSTQIPRPEEPAKRASRRATPARFRLLLALALVFSFCPLAHAGPVVDRIRSAGVIRCGGVPRPGLVGQSPDGRQAAGLYLDLCRAIGAALLGSDGRLEFRPYDSDRSFERVEEGADDLSFLDGSDIANHRLAGKAALGPAVYFVSTAAMVHADAPVRQLSDLAGKSICFYQGASAQMHLEGWMAAHRLSFARMGYMEYGELYDAYNAGVCDAEVGESGDLAAARLRESAETASRILPEPLSTLPVFAATPASDPQWSAIVAWAIYALQRAELTASPWAAAGVDSLGVEGRDLGLADDWAKRVVGAAGSYADIYARNLGDRSRLKLPRGPNAPAEAGGLFVAPYRE